MAQNGPKNFKVLKINFRIQHRVSTLQNQICDLKLECCFCCLRIANVVVVVWGLQNIYYEEDTTVVVIWNKLTHGHIIDGLLLQNLSRGTSKVLLNRTLYCESLISHNNIVHHCCRDVILSSIISQSNFSQSIFVNLAQ